MDLPDVQEDRKSTIRRLPDPTGRKEAGLFRAEQRLTGRHPGLPKVPGQNEMQAYKPQRKNQKERRKRHFGYDFTTSQKI